MFNLNDPRWGRGDDKPARRRVPREPDLTTSPRPATQQRGPRGQGPNQGPPDLDELWRDFNRKLGGLFGGKRGAAGPQRWRRGPGRWRLQPDMKSAGIGVGLIAGVGGADLAGHRLLHRAGRPAGRHHPVWQIQVHGGAGFNWRLPYPIQRHELVFVTQIRSVDVGRDNVIKATGLRESAMLTEDENIVEIKFAVQYRLSDARAFLFESKNPDDAVVQAAETAVREVVGKMRMDRRWPKSATRLPRVRT
jgi:membrane protease subunit HflK